MYYRNTEYFLFLIIIAFIIWYVLLSNVINYSPIVVMLEKFFGAFQTAGNGNQGGKELGLFAAAILTLILMLGFMAWLSMKSLSKPPKPEWLNNPLGLPKGSIRAIIALFFVATLLMAAGSESKLADWVPGVLGTIIGFYFGERSSECNGTGNGKQDPQKHEVAQGGGQGNQKPPKG
jgi:hypothetical protein